MAAAAAIIKDECMVNLIRLISRRSEAVFLRLRQSVTGRLNEE